MSTNKGIQIGDNILKKVQNHLMSSSVVMLKLWQALQDGESLSEEDIFGCIQRNIVLSGSAFSCFLNLEKTDSREFCRNNMPVFVVNLIEAQRMLLNLQKFIWRQFVLKKILKISEENKLFKQASKFASDNCQSHGNKGFQAFRKGSQLFSQPIPQKAKAVSDPPSKRVVFRSKSKRGASNSEKKFTP